MFHITRTLLLFLLFIVFIRTGFSGEVQFIQYDGFQLTMDCEKRSALRFYYLLERDTGTLKRRSSFSKDPTFSPNCQQISIKTYKNPGNAFDRGHLVPANHLDGSKLGIYQSNYATNILPMARNMNRGAWLLTEEISECYRDLGTLHIYGGPIYNVDRSKDFFIFSHGINTPSAFWKVIISENDHIAWIIPNVNEARRAQLDRYLVSIDKIESITGEHFQTIDIKKKSVIAEKSWVKPKNCNLS